MLEETKEAVILRVLAIQFFSSMNIVIERLNIGLESELDT